MTASSPGTAATGFAYAGATAVVTGAASGIGYALARALGAAGALVVLVDVDQEGLRTAVAGLEESGVRVTSRRIDVSEPGEVEGLAGWAWDAFGHVDLLFNNAGVDGYRGGPIWAASLADWSWTFGVNLWGVVHGTSAFLPRMLERGERAHIVNTSSLAAVTQATSMYGVAKHAVLAYTEVVHAELAAASSPVGITALIPGPVRTPFFSHTGHQGESVVVTQDRISGAAVRAAHAAYLKSEGVAPEAVAARALLAVECGELYAPTHPSTEEFVRARAAQLVEPLSSLGQVP